jgi:hypothetical protein
MPVECDGIDRVGLMHVAEPDDVLDAMVYPINNSKSKI